MMQVKKNQKKWLVDLHLKISLEEKFVSDYVDVIQENGQSTLGFNYLVMAAKWNQCIKDVIITVIHIN